MAILGLLGRNLLGLTKRDGGLCLQARKIAPSIRLHLSMEQRTSQNIKFSILSYEAQKSVQKSGAQWRTLYVLDHLAFG